MAARRSGRRLVLHGRSIPGPLHLLRRNENGLTFALGYVLQKSQRLTRALAQRLALPKRVTGHQLDIVLQHHDASGITDVELHDGRSGIAALIEAKITGWPTDEQLSRYASRLKREGTPRCVLVALAIPAYERHLWNRRRMNGVPLRTLRWNDVLTLVQDAARGASGAERDILREFSQWIQEVLRMQAYDREVLVRDFDTQSPSYALYLDANMYSCQPNESAEPLFFAPCFTGAKPAVGNGIHYVSRVYYRTVVPIADTAATRETLAAADDVVQRQVKSLKARKTAADQVEYLKGLQAKWRKGLRQAASGRRRDTNAVFFLGDPIRLPVPLRKRGKMVPIGFSMTLEHLMSAKPGTFNC